jgi:hypothetical protein
MVLRQVQADGEELLQVGLGGAFHHRAAGPVPAAMHQVGARFRLHLLRQVEEAAAGFHRAGDHLGRHAVVPDIEEARTCAGRPDRCRNFVQIAALGAIRDVDHRKSVLEEAIGHGAMVRSIRA